MIGGDARIRCWGKVEREAIPEDGVFELERTGLDVVSGRDFTAVLGIDRQVACYAPAAFVGRDEQPGSIGWMWNSVSLPSRAPIAELYATADFVCAISVSGEVACWGDGRIGSFDLVGPQLVLDPARVAR